MAASAPVRETVEILSALPLWLVLLPVLGSFFVYWGGRMGEAMRNYIAICITALCFFLAVYLFILAGKGAVVYRLVTFLDFGLRFRVDHLGALFTLLTSFLWLMAVIFSWTYMDHERNRDRYYYFLILTLGGCLGVFLMEDFFGLLLFFELMSLASYILVIHAETKEAMEAGSNYLYLGVIGGLCVLTGIFLLYSNTGTASIHPLLEQMGVSLPLRYTIAALFIAGFGIKAGMVPLHIWLPKAHPVAPSPASALLSGIMIKTGAYGIIRIVNMLFTPRAPQASLWEQTESLGYTIIWFGIATMFIAAFIALFQSNAKRILAYSSISQMGYILMGVGCAAYLGYGGAVGFAGTTYHIMNHAFFKAGMFMMVGAVYARTHELELSRLGGLYLDFPVTALAFLVCACGLAGVPGFNGYASKTLLHHAIVEAYEHHHLLSLYWAEKIFTLTSALTVCYITKLYTAIFFGSRPFRLRRLADEPFLEKAVFGVIAAGVIIMGLFPTRLLKSFVLPSTRGFVYDIHEIEHLLELNIWRVTDLQGIAVALLLGIFFFKLFSRSGAFSYRPPAWLSVEYLLYRPVVKWSGAAFTFAGRIVHQAADGFFVRGIAPLGLLSKKVTSWDDHLDPCILRPALQWIMGVYSGAAGIIDRAADGLVLQGIPPLNLLSRKVSAWDGRMESFFWRPLFAAALQLYTGGAGLLDSFAEEFFTKSGKYFLKFAQCMNFFDSIFLVGTGGRLFRSGKSLREFFYSLWMRAVYFCLLLGRGYARQAFSVLIKMDYDHKGEKFFYSFNVLNFDFAFVLLFIVLLSLLVIGLFFL